MTRTGKSMSDPTRINIMRRNKNCVRCEFNIDIKKASLALGLCEKDQFDDRP